MDITVSHNNINFRANLTREIVELERKTNPQNIKRYFINSPYNDDFDMFKNIDFKDNKAYALACRMTAEIFKNFRKKHDYRDGFVQELVFPRDIFVYNDNELTKNFKKDNKEPFFFEISLTHSDIIKNLRIVKHTILLQNRFKSLEDVNSAIEVNDFSTKHFMHWFVHEWLHAIQERMIYKKADYSFYVNYEDTILYNAKRKVTPKENAVVSEVLGEYAARQGEGIAQYSEIFAEAWTKFICNSLDKDCVHLKRDPLDELKKTPKEFQKILKKVSNITFINYSGNPIN